MQQCQPLIEPLLRRGRFCRDRDVAVPDAFYTLRLGKLCQIDSRLARWRTVIVHLGERTSAR
jgi:hypothetical protein